MRFLLLCLTLIFASSALAYTDQERVRDRLKLIEELLRDRNSAAWSKAKIESRSRSLDYLHEYWTHGQYPKNLTHPTDRHPIFVDPSGVPCAVGYLMLRSGFTKAVARIHQTQNEAYIEEIVDEEMLNFIESSGLELEELKLIQPGYAPPGPPEKTVQLAQSSNWDELSRLAKPELHKVLIYGVSERRMDLIKFALEKGADPNINSTAIIHNGGFAQHEVAGFPLKLAAENGSHEILDYLIERGARAGITEALIAEIRITRNEAKIIDDRNLDSSPAANENRLRIRKRFEKMIALGADDSSDEVFPAMMLLVGCPDVAWLTKYPKATKRMRGGPSHVLPDAMEICSQIGTPASLKYLLKSVGPNDNLANELYNTVRHDRVDLLQTLAKRINLKQTKDGHQLLEFARANKRAAAASYLESLGN